MATFPSDSVRTKDWGTEVLTDSDLEAQLDLLHDYIKAALNSSSGHDHSGTSNQGKKVSPANLVIASQAAADVLVASSASAWKRLAKGTASQFLKMNSGATDVEWGDGVTAAAQSDQETGTSTTTYVSPGRQQFHPSAAKAWIKFDGTDNSVDATYNADGTITDNGTGDYTVAWTTDISSANYAVAAFASATGGAWYIACGYTALPAAGTVRVSVLNNSLSVADVAYVSVIAFGDLT